jgi:hypothetical protein
MIRRWVPGICPGAAGFVLHYMVVTRAKRFQMAAQNIDRRVHHRNSPNNEMRSDPTRNLSGRPSVCTPCHTHIVDGNIQATHAWTLSSVRFSFFATSRSLKSWPTKRQTGPNAPTFSQKIRMSLLSLHIKILSALAETICSKQFRLYPYALNLLGRIQMACRRWLQPFSVRTQPRC